MLIGLLDVESQENAATLSSPEEANKPKKAHCCSSHLL
jgi:hypothetical protein